MASTPSDAGRRVSYQMESVWDFAYEPTSRDIETLYQSAKKSQWDASTAVDWRQAVDRSRPILQLESAFDATQLAFLSEEQKTEIATRMLAWRLSQILHGEQGGLLAACQLVNALDDLDSKLCAAMQVADESRHVEVFQRYLKRIHGIYPVDPVLKTLMDEILASEIWGIKLVGMQLLIEGMAMAGFTILHKQTTDPLLRDLLRRIIHDESRHVTFGYFALHRALPAMSDTARAAIEDFALRACRALWTRDEATGLCSVRTVFREMGWDPEVVWRAVATSDAIKSFNGLAFGQIILPRLERLGLVSPRVRPAYVELGFLDA